MRRIAEIDLDVRPLTRQLRDSYWFLKLFLRYSARRNVCLAAAAVTRAALIHWRAFWDHELEKRSSKSKEQFANMVWGRIERVHKWLQERTPAKKVVEYVMYFGEHPKETAEGVFHARTTLRMAIREFTHEAFSPVSRKLEARWRNIRKGAALAHHFYPVQIPANPVSTRLLYPHEFRTLRIVLGEMGKRNNRRPIDGKKVIAKGALASRFSGDE